MGAPQGRRLWSGLPSLPHLARLGGRGQGCRPATDRLLGDRQSSRLDRGGHYVDNDVGASRHSKKSSRQECRRLLGDIQAGNIDAVVIWMEDRLQRQVIELAEFLKVCDTAGVTRIASAGGEFDLSDADQRTTLYIKAAIAEAEIEKMSKRMRRRNKEAAEHGECAPGGKRPLVKRGAASNR